MIELLLKTLHEEQRVLSKVFLMRDYIELQKIAHRLLGVGAISETPRLKATTMEFEKQLREKNYDVLPDLYQQVQASIDEILKYETSHKYE